MKILKFIIIIFLFSIVIAAEDYGSYNYTYIGDRFSIECPANVNIEQKAEASSFTYSFNYANQTILKAYSGLQPDFNNPEDSDYFPEEGQINSCPCRSFKITDPNGNITGQVLINIMINQELLTYVHYWYENLSIPQVELIEKIIKSTKPYIAMDKAGL